MINHIILDCKKFKNSEEVQEIRTNIDEYSEKAEGLRKRVLT